MHTDQGDQFQLDLHLSGTERYAQGEPNNPVCKLWMQRMLEQGLRDTIKWYNERQKRSESIPRARSGKEA